MKTKFKYHKTMRYLLYILLVIFTTSCDRVRINQKITPVSVIDNTVRIKTSVRTYKWYGVVNTIEYLNVKIVNENIVDSISKIEYDKSLKIYSIVKKYYKKK